MELTYLIIFLAMLLCAIFAPGLLIKFLFYFVMICLVVFFLAGCSGENWKFTPNGKIRSDEHIIKEKRLEVEEIQGQFEYKF